jgi:hypothetical protein
VAGAFADEPIRPASDVQPEEERLFRNCLAHIRHVYGLGDDWPGTKAKSTAEGETMNPFEKPANYDRAVEIMMSSPGMSYSAAAAQAEQERPSPARKVAARPQQPAARPSSPGVPWNHEAALQVMRDRPGELGYEDALQYAAIHAEPPQHRAAVQYMLDNPGLQYADAMKAMEAVGGEMQSGPSKPVVPGSAPPGEEQLSPSEIALANKFVSFIRQKYNLPKFPN